MPNRSICRFAVLLNPDHFAWSNRLKGPQRRRDQRQEVFERVARGAKYDDGKLELGDVLLKLEILVAGQNTSKPAASALRSNSPFLRPVHDCCCTVRTAWPGRCVTSCRGSCSSSRMRTRSHRFMRGFQCSNGLLARHGRKRVKELVQTVISFEIIDQVAKRDPRADKNRCAAENSRVAVNDIWNALHGISSTILTPQRAIVEVAICEFNGDGPQGAT